MRFLDALECRRPDRIPFVPAIYEYKAWLAGSVPSRICRDAGLLAGAVLKEFELVRPDALVVCIDPYNIEAEAAGSVVKYYGDEDSSIPSLDPGGERLRGLDEVRGLRVPNPLTDGRMPLHLDAAERVQRMVGREVPVRGALSGPFSMAAGLLGAQNLFMALNDDPASVRKLLNYCSSAILAYGREFLARSCGVVIFDSQASPEVISPRTFREFVLEPTRILVGALRDAGARHVPLIIGGNTLPIIDGYLETGANNLLCDFRVPFPDWLKRAREAGRSLRRSIDPTGFLTGDPDTFHAAALREIAAAGGYPGFILGTGVVPFGTPLEVLGAIRDAAGKS